MCVEKVGSHEYKMNLDCEQVGRKRRKIWDHDIHDDFYREPRKDDPLLPQKDETDEEHELQEQKKGSER